MEFVAGILKELKNHSPTVVFFIVLMTFIVVIWHTLKPMKIWKMMSDNKKQLNEVEERQLNFEKQRRIERRQDGEDFLKEQSIEEKFRSLDFTCRQDFRAELKSFVLRDCYCKYFADYLSNKIREFFYNYLITQHLYLNAYNYESSIGELKNYLTLKCSRDFFPSDCPINKNDFDKILPQALRSIDYLQRFYNKLVKQLQVAKLKLMEDTKFFSDARMQDLKNKMEKRKEIISRIGDA